jgi:hypothetical protein
VPILDIVNGIARVTEQLKNIGYTGEVGVYLIDDET